jgi:hypothetical protein
MKYIINTKENEKIYKGNISFRGTAFRLKTSW